MFKKFEIARRKTQLVYWKKNNQQKFNHERIIKFHFPRFH